MDAENEPKVSRMGFGGGWEGCLGFLNSMCGDLVIFSEFWREK